MAIKIGTTSVVALKLGTTAIDKVYAGASLVFDTGGGATYLNKAANFGDNQLRSVADWGLADGTAFTFVAGIETPAAWISPTTAQYIFATETSLRAYLTVRSPDHKLLFRLFDSSGTKIVEMLSTLTLATSTKYLIGVSWSAADGNQMYVDGVATALDSSINLGGTADLTDGKMSFGGRPTTTTNNFQGRIGPAWIKNSRDDFATAWSSYHDGAGFLDVKNGAFTRMAWEDFNSDGSDGAAFEIYGGGSVPLESWGDRWVDRHGFIKVSGNQIVSEDNSAVFLMGMSMFWSIWDHQQYWNKDLVDWLVDDWKINVIRCAMAVEINQGAPDQGWIYDPTGQTALMETVVDAAIARGIYVVIDWHTGTDDPYLSYAQQFFAYFAEKYGSYPNVIWEIWNEPNTYWAPIREYAEAITPTIRQYSDNLIIVGSPWKCANPNEIPADQTVSDANTAYVRHSYVNNDPGGADSSITKTSAAQANGLAIYCSEWGETDGSGGITDPTLNLPAANEWIAWCQAHGVGGMNKWSISHLTQGSAVLLPGASALGGWDPETDLKPSGIYIRNKIREINGGGSSINYLDQAADLGAYRVRSVNNWTMADGTSFTFFGAIETPSAWLSPAVNQYLFTTGINNYAFLRIRDSDRKLLFRLYDSSFVKICEMISTATMSLSTKYLIGISWDSTAGNQMYINGSAAALDSSVNVGGTAKLTDDKLTLGGRAADDTMNLNGRLGPMWFKGARDDFTTAWIDYYDGTGFVDAANGALTRMAWADLNSDGTDSAAFEVPGGSVTLEDWVVPEGFSVNFDGVPLTFDSVQVRFT